MLGYLAVLGSTLSGLAELPHWTIGVAAIALMSASQAQYRRTLLRAHAAGLVGIGDVALLKSAIHAAAASAAAYAGGWLISLT